MQVETTIGLRYLRSKKRSTFLSVITIISVSGVALGVITMVVVLSVMSGFEQDLKIKILGSNAHGIVKKSGDDFTEYNLVIQKAKKIKAKNTFKFTFTFFEIAQFRRILSFTVKKVDEAFFT